MGHTNQATNLKSLIVSLHEEHRNARRLLLMLDHQAGLIERDGEPDYDLLLSIANYFCEYPDRCHHPKEDAVFRRMQAVHPAAASLFEGLPREHRDANARIRRFRDTIGALFKDHVVARDKVVSAARGFVEAEREHMTMEEDGFFPAALEVLNKEDWLAIETDLRGARDPLFGDIAEDEFRMLRECLTNWERHTPA